MNLATTPNASVPADELDPRTRLTRLETGLVALLTTSALLNYVDRQAVAVVSPTLKEEFHLTNQMWGWVGAVFSLSYVVTAAFGGWWVDRVGVRKALLVSTIVWCLAAAGHGLAHDFASLCFWRVMLALGEGPGGATLLKGIRRVTPPRFRDMGTAIIGAGTLLGAVLSPILIDPLATAVGWRAAFVVTASLGGLWLPFWIAVTRLPNANLEARAIGEVEAPAGKQDTPAPKRTLTATSCGIWATALCIFFTVPATVWTLQFFPSYLQDTFGIKHSGSLQWQPSLAMDIGQLAAGTTLLWLLRSGWSFLKARRLVMTLGFLGATTMTLMIFAPNLQWAMGWLIFSRFCFQFAYVGLLAYGISVVAEGEAGRMNGFMNAVFGACGAVFGPLIGTIIDMSGKRYGPSLILVGFIPLVGLTCWTILSSLHARRNEKYD